MSPGSLPLDLVGGIWSLREEGSFCGVPLVPTVTSGLGAKVIPGIWAPRVWGWTPPGDLAAATAYGARLIADVELRSTNKYRPDAGWTGAELDDASAVAPMVGGVTSHGFVLRQLRGVLRRFAAVGAVAYPQVYPRHATTEPRQFLRECVGQYRALGFSEVRPLLGVSAGLERLAVWLDESRRLGVRPDLWNLARARAVRLCDSPVKPTQPPGRTPGPSTGRVPAQADPAERPDSGGDWSGLALLLVVAGIVYRLGRSPT